MHQLSYSYPSGVAQISNNEIVVTHLYLNISMLDLPGPENPSCLQTVNASCSVHSEKSHTVAKEPLTQTSTRPWDGSVPFTNRTSPRTHVSNSRTVTVFLESTGSAFVDDEFMGDTMMENVSKPRESVLKASVF